MTNGEFMNILSTHAKEYAEIANKNINANKHMNNLNGKCKFTEDEISAFLADFLNYVAMHQCNMDYAIRASDIIEPPSIPWEEYYPSRMVTYDPKLKSIPMKQFAPGGWVADAERTHERDYFTGKPHKMTKERKKYLEGEGRGYPC